MRLFYLLFVKNNRIRRLVTTSYCNEAALANVKGQVRGYTLLGIFS